MKKPSRREGRHSISGPFLQQPDEHEQIDENRQDGSRHRADDGEPRAVGTVGRVEVAKRREDCARYAAETPGEEVARLLARRQAVTHGDEQLVRLDPIVIHINLQS